MKLLAIAIFLLALAPAYAQQYVFDRADILDEAAIESEIAAFRQETKGIIIIETTSGEDVDPELMFHENHRLGTDGQPDLNLLVVFDAGKKKGFVVYSSFYCKMKTAYDGIFHSESVIKAIENSAYTEAFLQIVKTIREEAKKTYFCPVNLQSQTFGCLFGSVQKPHIAERIIDEKERQKINPTAVVLHYTGKPSLEESVSALQERGLAVQFMVDKDGTIYQLMKDIETMSSGARCANRNSINVEIVGQSERELFANEKQTAAVSSLTAWLSQQYDIDLLQQKAASPQSGLVSHYEVDIACPAGTGKSDPGPLYMAKVRTNLCRRSMLFDISLGEQPTKERLERNKLALDRLSGIKSNVVHVILADEAPSTDAIEAATKGSIPPDCMLVVTSEPSVYSQPFACALRAEEIDEIERGIIEDVKASFAEGRTEDAVFLAASEVSKKIEEAVSEDPLISALGAAGDQLGAAIRGFFNPTGCAACPTAEAYAQGVLATSSKLSTQHVEEAYRKALAKYSPSHDPFRHSYGAPLSYYGFKETVAIGSLSSSDLTTMSVRIMTWPMYLMPQLFRETRKENVYEIIELPGPVVFRGETFQVQAPGFWNCRIKIVTTNRYSVPQISELAPLTAPELREVTRDEKIPCSSMFESSFADVTSGSPDGDCRYLGDCKITLSNGYIFKGREEITAFVLLDPSDLVYTNIIYVDTEVQAKADRLVRALHNAVVTASQNKFGIKVSPEQVYTIAMGEGMNIYTARMYLRDAPPVVSGFGYLGTDNIGSEVDMLKTDGFVSSGLDVLAIQRVNELGETVTTGNFQSLEDGLEAAAGTIAHRKYLLSRDLKQFGVEPESLTRKQLNFWVYYYFNAGAGAGKKALRQYAQDGVLNDESFINVKQDEQVFNGENARHNAIIRATMTETMYELGLLHLPGYS